MWWCLVAGLGLLGRDVRLGTWLQLEKRLGLLLEGQGLAVVGVVLQQLLQRRHGHLVPFEFLSCLCFSQEALLVLRVDVQCARCIGERLLPLTLLQIQLGPVGVENDPHLVTQRVQLQRLGIFLLCLVVPLFLHGLVALLLQLCRTVLTPDVPALGHRFPALECLPSGQQRDGLVLSLVAVQRSRRPQLAKHPPDILSCNHDVAVLSVDVARTVPHHVLGADIAAVGVRLTSAKHLVSPHVLVGPLGVCCLESLALRQLLLVGMFLDLLHDGRDVFGVCHGDVLGLDAAHVDVGHDRPLRILPLIPQLVPAHLVPLVQHSRRCRHCT
mmetsp:Transcript_16767/g.40228  ORF Transcript_16767/g.40228 Transcript_16767/m.40228 type:complete len:327 (+) Transcript_16767:1050-2030(+)